MIIYDTMYYDTFDECICMYDMDMMDSMYVFLLDMIWYGCTLMHMDVHIFIYVWMNEMYVM